jgi:hypothetical protein
MRAGGMRWALTIMAVLFGIPLLFLAWLLAVGGKVIFIKNPNAIPVSIQVATESDSYTETTDPKAVAAGALTWLIFKPQIAGDSGLLCTGMRGTTRKALGTPEHPLPMFSKVTLASCEGPYVLRMIRPHRVVRRHHITPPQPL